MGDLTGNRDAGWVSKGPLTGFRCLQCENHLDHELSGMTVRVKCSDFCNYLPAKRRQAISVQVSGIEKAAPSPKLNAVASEEARL